MCQCQTAIISLLSCNLLLWLSALLPLKMIVHLFAFYLFWDSIYYKLTYWTVTCFFEGLSICLSFIALIMRDLWAFIMCNPMSRPDLTQHPGRCGQRGCHPQRRMVIVCTHVKGKVETCAESMPLRACDMVCLRTCQEMHFFFAQLLQGVIQRKKLVRSMVFTDLTRF